MVVTCAWQACRYYLSSCLTSTTLKSNIFDEYASFALIEVALLPVINAMSSAVSVEIYNIPAQLFLRN
jgi:hypothetical protein